ncbi:hypothetical protein AB205_0199170, partial [Aquarana catesbeiana]
PSSTPKVIFSCQKNGSVIVFCVVEKDQNVTYKWTVNGTAFYRENSSNVTFSKEELKTVPMNVSCSVQNSVSMKESNNTQISCPEWTSTAERSLYHLYLAMEDIKIS